MKNIKLVLSDIGNYPKIQVTTEKGGYFSVTDYRSDGRGEDIDIGYITQSNTQGIGGGTYIKNRESLDQQILYVNQTSWLNDEEKEAIIAFFEMMRY
jgi:hypothetical protein